MVSALLLLLVVFAAWVLIILAGLVSKSLDEDLRKVPDNERHGVCIAPVIPLAPLAAWGFALMVDIVARPWGTWSVGIVHVLFGLFSLASIAWDICRLHSFHKTVSGPHRANSR